MSEDRRRVLDLLAQGKITVDEAEQLLAALADPRAEKAGPEKSAAPGDADARPRFLRIEVHKAGDQDRPGKAVNIRVPVPFMRSGLRLGAVIPGFASERMQRHLRERGVDVDLEKLDFARLDAMLTELGEMTIDVDNGRKQVRLRYE
jgi:hypothetical protein